MSEMDVSDKILDAMRRVPRWRFIPPEHRLYADTDYPVPIGWGQTTSQPHLIAWMIDLLELQPGDKVLEVGTGSGYVTAILAELGGMEIYSVEIIPALAEQAAAQLRELGYAQLHLRQGDGYLGWEACAPFNAILVSAAADHLPPPLAQQLAEGGRLVIPIGPPGDEQTLWKFVKRHGALRAQKLGLVAFVPLRRDADDDE
jgi:protein-L-isoaspartate(D-aspartate) O-methyltransferase